jgi:CP family cyanate transporter-like MFS transporter
VVEEAGRTADPTTGRPAPGRRTVLAAILLLTLTLRPAVTGTSALLPRISADVPLSLTQAGLLGSLPPFCFAAAGLLTPWLSRRLSAERVAVLLLLVAATAQCLRPWAPGPWTFLGGSVPALVALGAGNVVLPPIVKAWFPDRIPAVTALYVTGVSLGTAYPPLLAVPIADAVAAASGSAVTGWRVSLAAWGAGSALVVLAWLLPAAHPKVVPLRGPSPTPPSPDGDPHRPRLPIWRSRVACGITVLFGVQSFAAYVMFSWLPTRLVDAGVSEQRAAAMLALFGVMGLPTSLVVPRLVARVRNTPLLVASFVACFEVGLVALAVAPTTLTTLWVVVSGWGSGLFPLALTLVGLRSRTPATAGALSGFAQGLGYLVAATGPFVAGAVHDATGSWTVPFGLTAAVLLLVLGAGWLLRDGRTVDEDLAARPPVTLDG